MSIRADWIVESLHAAANYGLDGKSRQVDKTVKLWFFDDIVMSLWPE